jgi:hypothetical protein
MRVVRRPADFLASRTPERLSTAVCWRRHGHRTHTRDHYHLADLLGEASTLAKEISLSAYQPISLSAYQPISLSAYQPISLSAYQPISLSLLPSWEMPSTILYRLDFRSTCPHNCAIAIYIVNN